MTTGLRGVIVAVGVGAMLAAVEARAADVDAAAAAASPGREIPAAFTPFEYLIGSWKGTGVPAANKVRGWNETHAWAWKFEKGVPVGMSMTASNDKVLARAQLVFDPAAKTYTLAGAGPDGKPVSFSGALDKGGKMLTLDRAGTTSDGARQRLTMTPNANFVRYTLRVSEQETGAPQFKPVIEVGLTKEGESFAAGGAAADLPKCIVTGGAATMNVSYQGKTFPLCCSGCKDEFNDNPEKYIKKLALRNEAGAGKSSAKPVSSTNKDDGAFGDVVVDTPKPPSTVKPAPKTATETPKATAPDNSARAASLLRIAQNLEKGGKAAAALTSYRQVVKLYPETPSAKTAAARIKALGAK